MKDDIIGFKKPEWIFIAFVTNYIFVFYVIFEPTMYSESSTCTHDTSTKFILNDLKDSILSYKVMTGHFPSKLEDLVSKPKKVKNWRQFLEFIPRDPWNNEFVYTLEDSYINISSHGPGEMVDDDIILKIPIK